MIRVELDLSSERTWARTVTGFVAHERGARHFEGRYLRSGGNRLDEGALVLVVVEDGREARLYRVDPSSSNGLSSLGHWSWRQQFSELCVAARNHLDPVAPAVNALNDVPAQVTIESSLQAVVAESRPQTTRGRRSEARRREIAAEREVSRQRVREIILAGAAADGQGALLGWEGCGAPTHEEMVRACTEAGCPDLAPSPRSDLSHAGEAVMRLNNARCGLMARRENAPKGSTAQSRGYIAIWTVNRQIPGAKRGQAGSTCVLTATLRANGDLDLEGPTELAEMVRSRYVARRNAEVYRSGDVTDWLQGVLKYEFGCAKHVLGWYVTAGQRERATRLMDALDRSTWGFISPPLSVATGDELALGIAKGWIREIERLEGKLEAERAAAERAKKTEISATIAANLLADLADLDREADTYRNVLGTESIRGLLDRLRALRSTLSPLATTADVRFALLELDGETAFPQDSGPKVSSPAERAAERASEEKRRVAAANAAMQEQGAIAACRERYASAMERSGLDPMAFKTACESQLNGDRSPAAWAHAAEIVAPLEPTSADVRFSLLELD